VADGRGTPSRGPAWDRTIFRDLATLPLADQVVAVAQRCRPKPGRDSRLVIWWLSGGPSSSAPPRRIPRSSGRRTRDRLAAVRHGLYRALLG
jgi:dipeptidyl-peptidase-4